MLERPWVSLCVCSRGWMSVTACERRHVCVRGGERQEPTQAVTQGLLPREVRRGAGRDKRRQTWTTEPLTHQGKPQGTPKGKGAV